MTDEIGNAWTSGGVTTSAIQNKFGGKSLYFNGSSIATTSSTISNFGPSNFTIDVWIYPTSSTLGVIAAKYTSWAGNTDFYFYKDASGHISFDWANQTYSLMSTTTVPLNTWSHLAVVRSGSSWVLYINGNSAATLTNSASISNNQATLTLGGNSG